MGAVCGCARLQACKTPIVFCLQTWGGGLVSAIMKRILLSALASAALLNATAPLLADDVEPGFTSLLDGKTFDGWKPAEVNKDTWKVEDRSEEHTSELQSLRHLVCRLLLE